ncbi:MAG TPA: cobalamin-binding protein [Candidatus Angelobacter sp.]|nr:cobalamin-binding protein [Candidatus Angelobacter sp.]
MRICSLLPGATEIVFSLGMGGSVVGVSHECDYPPQARALPRVTRSTMASGLSSREIDDTVENSIRSGTPLYALDVDLLEQLKPDLIITQGLCDVCAVSVDLVHEAIGSLSCKPRVLDLKPHGLADILANIREVGSVLGCEQRAGKLLEELETRIATVQSRAEAAATRPKVLTLEWVEPPYCGGHWMAELVAIAGGHDDLANHGRPSYRIEWNSVISYAPEIIVLTCCGFDLARTRGEVETLAAIPGIFEVPAVKNGQVYATAGSGYFSRPGPRVVDSLEILAHLIHPELFAPPPFVDAFASVQVLPASEQV